MNKKLLFLFIILTTCSLFSLHSYETRNEAQLNESFFGFYPHSTLVNYVSDPFLTTTLEEKLTYKALTSVYDESWFETYVDPKSIYHLNLLYNEFLAAELPAKVLIGGSKKLDTQTSIKVVVNNKSVLNLVWETKEDKRALIVAINIK
jgi:hypothetical protein